MQAFNFYTYYVHSNDIIKKKITVTDKDRMFIKNLGIGCVLALCIFADNAESFGYSKCSIMAKKKKKKIKLTWNLNGLNVL